MWEPGTPHRYEATQSVAKTGGRADGESARSALRAAPSGRNDDVTRTGMQSARRRNAGERVRNGPRSGGGGGGAREPAPGGAGGARERGGEEKCGDGGW